MEGARKEAASLHEELKYRTLSLAKLIGIDTEHDHGRLPPSRDHEGLWSDLLAPMERGRVRYRSLTGIISGIRTIGIIPEHTIKHTARKYLKQEDYSSHKFVISQTG